MQRKKWYSGQIPAAKTHIKQYIYASLYVLQPNVFQKDAK